MVVRGLQNVDQYAQRPDDRADVRASEDVSFTLNEHTSISTACDAASKHVGGMRSDEAFGASAQVLKALRTSLLSEAMVRDADVTKEF